MNEIERPTPFQALMWLNDQRLIPKGCLFGRVNLIGGLILWTLARNNIPTGQCPPRLFLYGNDFDRVYFAASNVARLMGLRWKPGKVPPSYRTSAHPNLDHVFVVEPGRRPPDGISKDGRLIVFAGAMEPHRWIADRTLARFALPIRIPDHGPIEDELAVPIPIPNPLDVIVNAWQAAGRPRAQDSAHYAWPVETTEWRTRVEDVLVFAGWPWKPRSIATVEDF